MRECVCVNGKRAHAQERIDVAFNVITLLTTARIIGNNDVGYFEWEGGPYNPRCVRLSAPSRPAIWVIDTIRWRYKPKFARDMLNARPKSPAPPTARKTALGGIWFVRGEHKTKKKTVRLKYQCAYIRMCVCTHLIRQSARARVSRAPRRIKDHHHPRDDGRTERGVANTCARQVAKFFGRTGGGGSGVDGGWRRV